MKITTAWGTVAALFGLVSSSDQLFMEEVTDDGPHGGSTNLVEFVMFMSKYNKVYPTQDEKFKRFQQFKTSKKQVEEINKLRGSSMSKMNKDADMFDEEWALRTKMLPDSE